MNKRLKRFLFLIATSIIGLNVVSCSLDVGNSKVIEIISNYENLDALSINNNIVCDGTLSSNRKTYISSENDIFNAYSNINISASKLSNNSHQFDEYVKNSIVYYEVNEVSYNKIFENENNIWKFVGLDTIFEDAKKQELNNQKVSGSLDASLCSGIVRSFIVDIGSFNDNYQNYYFNSQIDYSIYFNLENKSIVSIELDITDVAKLKNSSINEVVSTLIFSLDEDVNKILNEHPFPSNGDINNDISTEKRIKEEGIQFINDVYEDIKYVSDDLYFYTNSIISPRLSFSYESNKANVISNTGKYYEVSADIEVTITVHLFYSKVEYETLSFTFLAIPKPIEGIGDLGSPTNYLYKGRKKIEDVEINFIEMHQQYGDSIYIKAGDFDMLIDAGDSNDGGYVNDFLRRNVSDGRIELVVATHAHSDHIGGMITALSTFPNVSYTVDYGYTKSDYSLVTNVRNRFKQADKYAPITDCIDNLNGARKTLYISNDFYITFLDTGYYELPSVDFAGRDYNANLTSVALILTYKNQNYYFAGDLESEGEYNLVNNGELKKVDVAKASHHGSTTSNSRNILSSLDAEVMVISTALVNRGSEKENAENQIHPIGRALENMLDYSKVYCNFTMGTVQVTCDGNTKIDVKGLGLSSPYYMDGKAVTGEENIEFKYTKYAKRYRSSYI